MVIALVGNVDPQTSAVRDFLAYNGYHYYHVEDHRQYPVVSADLVIVAGYRRIIDAATLAVPRYGTVGFHSAKLPEYPGRAPIPWTLIRGGPVTNTLLYLDEGVDSGDVIGYEQAPLVPGDTPERLYQWVAASCVRLLERHLPAILDGTASRTPQDPAKRGPLTTTDGWARWLAY